MNLTERRPEGDGYSSARRLGGECDVIELPPAHRVGCGNLKRRALRGIIQVRSEVTSRFEKVRFPGDVLIDLNWLRRNTKLRKPLNDILLLRRRIIQFRLRSEMIAQIFQEGDDGEFCHRVPCEGARFLVRGRFV